MTANTQLQKQQKSTVLVPLVHLDVCLFLYFILFSRFLCCQHFRFAALPNLTKSMIRPCPPIISVRSFEREFSLMDCFGATGGNGHMRRGSCQMWSWERIWISYNSRLDVVDSGCLEECQNMINLVDGSISQVAVWLVERGDKKELDKIFDGKIKLMEKAIRKVIHNNRIL